jgi:hypothetical protein
MRSLLDFFRKKEDTTYTKPFSSWTINGKEYLIKESFNIKSQVANKDIQIYGWSLETRFKIDGKWSAWHKYYNNRIYVSMSSAIDAGIKTHRSGEQNVDWRICPLYKMEHAEYREYKIDQLFGEKDKNKFEIKSWVLEEDYDRKLSYNNSVVKYKKGTIFIQTENGSILISATPKISTTRHQNNLFKEIQKLGKIKEVDIMDMKQIHPHLLKELKQKLNIKK